MKANGPEMSWSPEQQGREELRHWIKLPFHGKLKALEEMGDLGRFFLQQRRSRGLPYFDPDGGKLVVGGEAEKAETLKS